MSFVPHIQIQGSFIALAEVSLCSSARKTYLQKICNFIFRRQDLDGNSSVSVELEMEY